MVFQINNPLLMPGVVVRHSGKIMISSSNLRGLGLLLAVTLMSFPRESMCQSFDLGDSAYNCSSTLVCLGDAHRYNGSVYNNSDGSFAGKLSLISEVPVGNDRKDRVGIAYYREPIRMLDRSRNLAASFNTTFAFAEVPSDWNQTTDDYKPGDGMALVVSADNRTDGTSAGFLGFFNSTGDNAFKSLVVEFDNYPNWDTSRNLNDIGWNHVAIDIGSELSVTSQSADNVNIQLWQPSTVYAWIEYSADMQELELRISNTTSRPSNPLLFYKLNLSEVVEEYMYVGFSGSTGGWISYYYIWNWTFESNFATPPTLSLSSHSKKKSLLIGLSVGLPCLAVVLGGCCLLVLARNRLRKRRVWQQLGCSPIGDDLTQKLACMAEGYRFSYQQLSVATGGFPETAKLGQGGFGSVYRGVLRPSGKQVAVKRLSGQSHQGEREFRAEVSTISQLRHRNLIQLLGWCKDRGEYMIVYELMPRGSLDKVLFYPRSAPFSWTQRYKILRGTAAAVDYLHQGWKLQVIHRDIKASNIMLDDDWDPKLGDFGLARLVDHLGTPPTTGVVGTPGYIAPEAVVSGKFTEKTDTFAFGTVALEIATGRRCTELGAAEDERVLVHWVWQRRSEDNLLSVADRRLGVDFDPHSMEIVLLMGLLCCHPNPAARPPMRHVVQVLAGDVPVPPVPSSRPTPVFLLTNSETPHSTPLFTSPGTQFTAPSTSDSGRVSIVADSSADDGRQGR